MLFRDLHQSLASYRSLARSAGCNLYLTVDESQFVLKTVYTGVSGIVVEKKFHPRDLDNFGLEKMTSGVIASIRECQAKATEALDATRHPMEAPHGSMQPVKAS